MINTDSVWFIIRLETLITNCRYGRVNVWLCYFKTLELNIVKVLSLMQIVDICRVMSISYSSKVKFTMLICILADVTSMCRHIEVYTSIELFIHCGCSSLGK